NLLEIVHKNKSRNFHDLALFESGPRFVGTDPQDESLVICGVRVGEYDGRTVHGHSRYVDFFDIKGDIWRLFEELGFNPAAIKLNEEVPFYYHPGKSATLIFGGKVVGHLGQIHPKVVSEFKINSEIYGFELFYDNLPPRKLRLGKRDKFIVSDYPAVSR